MKKLISILLLVCTLMFSFASCGANANQNNNDIDNKNHVETTVNNMPTCDTTGLHTYEHGECTSCKLKVFDVLKEYMTRNGTLVAGSTYRVAFGTYETDEYYGYLFYRSDKNCVDFDFYYNPYPGVSDPHKYYISLRFTPYTFEDGGYEWSASCTRLSCTCSKISGVLDPAKFSSSTYILEHTSSQSDADSISRNATKALQGCINNFLIKFTKDIGENMSIGSLGFKRYK